jgi:hypothetical protein
MRSRPIRIQEIVLLIVTSWALLATSVPTELTTGSYSVTSDCVIPTLAKEVNAVAGVITAPSGTNWTDFGFPQNTVYIGKESNGTVSGEYRSCRPTYGDEVSNTGKWLWSCFDNDAYTCTIMVEE